MPISKYDEIMRLLMALVADEQDVPPQIADRFSVMDEGGAP